MAAPHSSKATRKRGHLAYRAASLIASDREATGRSWGGLIGFMRRKLEIMHQWP